MPDAFDEALEPQTEETTEVEETTEPEPDPLAEREAALAKKEADLKEFEKRVNQRSTELGAIAKQLENAPKPEPEDDDNFDPKELEVFKKALKKVLGVDPAQLTRAASAAQATIAEQMEETTTDFFSSHPDADQATIVKELIAMNFDMDNATPVQLKRALNTAYKATKEPVDIDALVAARVEEALKKAKKAGGDGDIVDVKKGRGNAAGAKRSFSEVLEDPNADFWSKMDSAVDVNID